MSPRALSAVAALVLLGCPRSPPPAPPARFTLSRTGGTTFELLPAAEQEPFCLAFTVASTGVIRQLTMSEANQSFACPAGAPVGGHAFKVPLEEGGVRVHVIFSSAPVNAASVAQQLLDLRDRTKLAAMDLRLPGTVTVETESFLPELDTTPTVGRVLGADAGADGSAP